MEKTELLACPLTDAEIIHIFENSRLQSEHFTKESVTAAYVAALATLRSRTPPPDNKPLTVEELREMDGEPVWVEPTQEWRIVCVYSENGAVRLYTVFNTISAESVLRNDGRIYRRPPEKEE